MVANTLGKAGLGFALLLLGVGPVTQMTSLGGTVGEVLGLICGALLVVAEIRVARAGVARKDGVVIVRNWTRTWTIPQLDIAEVAVVPSGNVTGGATCVAFRLTDGRLIKAMPTASYAGRKVEGYQHRLMFL